MRYLQKIAPNTPPFDYRSLVAGELYFHWKNYDNSVSSVTLALPLPSEKTYNIFLKEYMSWKAVYSSDGLATWRRFVFLDLSTLNVIELPYWRIRRWRGKVA